MNEPSVEWSKATGNSDDHDYHGFLANLQDRFAANTANFKNPVFRVDAPDLWDVYIAHFKDEERQFHNCSACRRFIREAGGLVTIDEKGRQQSALWHVADAPRLYKSSVDAVAQMVKRAPIVSPYLTSDPTLGQPLTGVWRHMALTTPASAPFRYVKRVLSAKQRMAEMIQDFKSVSRALSEFSVTTLDTAVNLLKTDALYRSEKLLGAAEWLFKLQTAVIAAKTSQGATNVVWLAIATAPTGFCHPRSGVIGTLLEDLQTGLAFKDVAAKFKAKMHPLVYQRPQTAPKAGNVLAAERLVQQLGIAPSLERRYARYEDIPVLRWHARAEPLTTLGGAGVFGNVEVRKPKSKPPVTVPGKSITWRSFADTVLPTVESLELLVPSVGAFAALVTAVHADAPPILQWDLDDARNPMSWYQYAGGSLPSMWNLTEGAWVKVTAVTDAPHMWWSAGLFRHIGERVFFLLDGCRQNESEGLGLFPEILKSDLHSARRTLEAYSQTHKLQEPEQATACGVCLQPASAKVFPLLRVTLGGGVAVQYKIDRWD